MSAHVSYIKTSFVEIEEKTKGTELEGKRIHSYLDESTFSPMISYDLAKKLRFKNLNKRFQC
jgi:hypothetical protein